MAVSISLSITQNSQSIANNTSNVTVKVTAKWTYGSFNRNDPSGSCTINGTKYTFTSDFNASQTTSGSQTIYTKTLNIAHNSDGTKTLSCSASYATGVSSGTVTASASKTLTTIPRKSTMSVGNGTLGTAQTLTVTRKSTSFTHTITATCGSASTTICTKSSSTSISFTPPLAWSSQNTTGTSVSVKYTITTYTGSTSVGSNSYTVSCGIPASVKPTVSMNAYDATGYASTYGAYVQGLSKFTVSISASGSYGSTIKSYKTTANGGTYTSSSFTTGVLTSSGYTSISTTVTDSRGRTATAGFSNLGVLAYAVPKISAFSVVRCNQNGTANSGGSYMKVTFNSSVTSLNSKNKATYTLKYKKSTDSAYTTVTLSNYANNYAVSGGSYIFAADTTSSYNITLTLADNFKSVSANGTGATASKTISLYNQGKGIAFGKIAEKEGFLDSAYRMIVPNHSSGVTYISGKNGDNASIQISTQQTSDGYHPYMYVKSSSGHVWNIGGIGNLIGFWGFYSSQTANSFNWRTGWDTSTGEFLHSADMSIGGKLTLSSAMYVPNGNIIHVKNASGTNVEAVNWCGTGNDLTLGAGNYRNNVGSTYICGNVLYLWCKSSISANKSITVSSDRNLKKDFECFSDKHDIFFDNLKPTVYRYILGSDEDYHFGYIAQEVEEALEKADLQDFAGVSVITFTERETNIDDSARNYLLDKGLNEQHNIAYDEFISLNTWQIQKLKSRVDVLENRADKQDEIIATQQQEIDSLKEEVQRLKELVEQLVS